MVSEYEPLFDWAHLRPEIPLWLVIALLLVLVAGLAYLVYTDLKYMLLLNKVTYPMIVGSMVLAPVLWEDWDVHLITGATVAVLFFALANVKRRGQYAMGVGDVKLYTAAGFILGWGFLPCLIIAALVGVLQGVVFALGMNAKVAHGPHIVVGILTMLVIGTL